MSEFNLKEFFETESARESVVSEIGGISFRIRPLDGLETQEYTSKTETVDRVVWLLSHALLDGPDETPIDAAGASRLFAEHEPLAMELAVRILKLTEEVYREEEKRWETAKKKSAGPPTNGSEERTAPGMG